LFVSRLRSDGTFAPAELVPELSGAASDQRPSISHDGREIYFHSTRAGSLGNADIWVSTRPSVFDPWTLPTNVTELNTTYGEAQPTLSSQGDILIFNSTRPGSIGMTDLYVATRQKVKR
jgi:Tol biopolymer transport system component